MMKLLYDEPGDRGMSLENQVSSHDAVNARGVGPTWRHSMIEVETASIQPLAKSDQRLTARMPLRTLIAEQWNTGAISLGLAGDRTRSSSFQRAGGSFSIAFWLARASTW